MQLRNILWLLVAGVCLGYEGDDDDTVLPWEEKDEGGSDYSMVDSEYTGWQDQEIPVKFDSETLSAKEQKHIMNVLQKINDKVQCIKFVPFKNEKKKYLYMKKEPKDPWKSATTWFTNPDGSGNSLIVIRFKEVVEDEFLDMVLTHESLHVLGLGHTLRRSDRDEHIIVNWDNIPKNKWPQYDKCDTCDNMKLPYDCRSIMHYRECRYGKPCDTPVMTAKDPKKCDLKTLNLEMTENDVKLARMANCGTTKVLPKAFRQALANFRRRNVRRRRF